MLIKAPPAISKLPIDQFRDEFGEPETALVSRTDGESLPLGVPSHVIIPLELSKDAPDFTPSDAIQLVLCDFGEAFAPATDQRLGRECNTPVPQRAPETAFEPDQILSYPSDVWSLGVAIWEILGMKAIFSESEPMNEVIAEQIDVLGLQSLPDKWRALWERSGETEVGIPSRIPKRSEGKRQAWPPLEEAFEQFVQKYRRKWEDVGVFGEEETRMILDLMRGMLRFSPEERMTTQDVLASDWMVKWALPELENACNLPSEETHSLNEEGD